MTRPIFVATVEFIRRGGIPIILMSGGEPTEHPDLLGFVDYAKKEGLSVLLLSNGEWLHQWAPERRDELLGAVWRVQVTNDPAFYPRHVERYDHPKVYWETQLRQVTPHGRAATNRLRTGRRAPECFNLRSLTREMGTFHAARLVMIARGSMCTPSINVDGSVRAGECPECFRIGGVSDDETTLELNLRLMKCSKCGLVRNLVPEEKRAIGEAVVA